MTWYPDLGNASMASAGHHIRAVGWLSREHAFAQGGVNSDFQERLWQFANQWQASTTALRWGFFMGSHSCELCDLGPPPWRRFNASGNFGVPAGGLLFAAPQMIAHYVEVHRYRPPDEFIAAVLASPLPASAEYWALVDPFRHLHRQYLENKSQWLG
jgi:hypothetical protein